MGMQKYVWENDGRHESSSAFYIKMLAPFFCIQLKYGLLITNCFQIGGYFKAKAQNTL